MDADLIRRLERLAGLDCDPAEREALLRDLRRIVDFAADLAGPGEDAEAPRPPRDRPDASRADDPGVGLPRLDALSGAPAVEDGYFLAPPVRPPEDDDV